MNIQTLLKEKGGIRLDIGCGKNKQDGFVGLDMRDLPGVDIVWDVTDIPWPLPDECVLLAMASHLVEHISPANGGFLKFMDELWRVMRVDGEVAFSLPHGSSQGYLQDPTHCNPCNEATWSYFDPECIRVGRMLYQIYEPKPWRVKYLVWAPNANMEVILVKRGAKDADSDHG